MQPAPGQTVHVQPAPGATNPKWTSLVFHPDFLARSSLGRNMSRYEFFSYASNEALHLSDSEIEVYRNVLSMISTELHHAIDKHTKELIVSNIELLLKEYISSKIVLSSSFFQLRHGPA